MDRSLLIADLTRDEACKLFVYDDATGLLIRPGTLVKGHATIGIGRALDVHGISHAEALLLSNDDIDAVLSELHTGIPWFSGLDEIRQRVLCNMAFNLGASGLLSFKAMLAAIQRHDYPAAAHAMLASLWAKQVGPRATRLAQLVQQP